MKIEVYRDAAGHFRWRLRAANGEVIASSGESFANKANAIRAAENVRDNAGKAAIIEVLAK